MCYMEIEIDIKRIKTITGLSSDVFLLVLQSEANVQSSISCFTVNFPVSPPCCSLDVGEHVAQMGLEKSCLFTPLWKKSSSVSICERSCRGPGPAPWGSP